MKKRFETAHEFIHNYPGFILTCHETPDGDAIGSECALFHSLIKYNKQVKIFNSDPMGSKYQFLNHDNIIQVYNSEESLSEDISNWGLFILDTNQTSNIGIIADHFLPKVADYFIIDHHDDVGSKFSDNLIEADASSTCEIIYDLIKSLDIDIDLPIAEALYTGIIFDTGSFIYPKTSAKTFKIASHLVSVGVIPNVIYRHVYESSSIPALKLQAKVFSSLELHYNEHLAVQTMLREDIKACGARYEDGDTFINIPLKSGSIRVSVFFKENEEGILRCSIRSKGNINVAQIAQSFGGGGHKTAAGFKSPFPIETIKLKVLEILGPIIAEYEKEYEKGFDNKNSMAHA